MMRQRKPYAAPETDVLQLRHEEMMELAVISTEWKDAGDADARENSLILDDDEFITSEWSNSSI